MIDFVDTTTRDGNQSLWGAMGLTDARRARRRSGDGPGRLPRARLHVEHAHGRVGALPPRGPLGADAVRQRGDADTPLGIITTGMRFISWVPADAEVMALSFRLRRPQRHPADADRRSVQRPRPPETPRRDGPRRGHRGGRGRAHLLDQRRPHARLLRRARRRAGGLPRDGPPVPQGPGRAADARRGARAGPPLPRRGRRAPGRAAQPLHDRARAARLRRGRPGGLPGRPHRLGPALARHLPARGGGDRAQPRGRRVLAPARSRRGGDGGRALPTSWPASRACPPERRGSSTRSTTATSSRAGWSRPRGGCSRRSAGRSSSTGCSRRSRACAPRWATRSS